MPRIEAWAVLVLVAAVSLAVVVVWDVNLISEAGGNGRDLQGSPNVFSGRGTDGCVHANIGGGTFCD